MINVFLFLCLVIITKIGTDFYCVIAKKYKILDKPDAMRKLQKEPIPVGGGIVVFLVFVTTFFAACYLHFFPLSVSVILFPLIITSFILVICGLYDDRNGLDGKKKLLIQILISTIILIFAKDYSDISLLGQTCNLGHLFYPIAIFWLVGFINSINLLDGADGVVTSLGAYIFITIGMIAIINGIDGIPSITFVFTAALCGFFLCNKPPAKVYLGDTGSMLIGFVAGILVLRACTINRSIQVIPAICVVLIPILDSVFAIIRRKNSGRSIFSTDRGHIHHRIQKRFGRGYKLLGILFLLQFPLCLSALAGVYYQNDWIPLTVMFIFIVFIVASGIFGRAELKIVLRRLYFLFIKRFDRDHYEKYGEVFHPQGTVCWTNLWEYILKQIRKSSCVSIQLDINMPFINEDYYSEWDNFDKDTQLVCNISVPFIIENKLVGMLYMKYDLRKMTFHEALLFTENLCNYCLQYIIEHNSYFAKKHVS
ncbi:MAG: MraY family glycosyltransferase [Planctomycetia bacterium]|nr:MraY family glycosyltransferase [Planctomycetia bacterium]